MPILSYRYRLLPTKGQHRALKAILESQRALHNAALEERIGAYEKAGVSRNYMDQTKALTEWRAMDADARALPVALQRATLKRLEDAFTGFFRRLKVGDKPGFPRFRGPGRFDCFGFREMIGISLDDGRIRFKGMPGRLRVHMHRPIPEQGLIKNCTFVRSFSTWTVSFAVEVPAGVPRLQGRAVGIDLGVTTFAALSDGGFIPSVRAALRSQRKLRLAQRALARKHRGSRGRSKARAAVASVHAAIRRQRNDFLHKATARLVREYDVVAIERLNVRALARSGLAREARDASWGRFISMLRYKAECAGVRLIEVDSRDTSQLCSGCGTLVPKDLSERVHRCPTCFLSMDRDLNAARNILFRAGVGPGLRNVVGLCGMRAGENLGQATAETLPRFDSDLPFAVASSRSGSSC